jgi:hypothetical protein
MFFLASRLMLSPEVRLMGPLVVDAHAAVALEIELDGRALVVGVGQEDGLRPFGVKHHQLVATGGLQSLEVVAVGRVVGPLRVVGVEDVAEHDGALGQAVLVADEHLRAALGGEELALAVAGVGRAHP